jgi:hypothetical protein
MLTIKRTCTNKIITRALQLEGQPLIAILLPGADDCNPCENEDQLLELLENNPGAMIVYNQHADAINLINQLQRLTDQVFIEIRQDTRGVLGLQAEHRSSAGQEPLELDYSQSDAD